jgi:hypothetical protein
VLEDVAVEEIELLTLEAVREVHRDPNGLPRLHEHGVLPAEVVSGTALPVHREVRDLLGAAGPAQHPEPEGVQVHGVGHASLLVADLPDFYLASLSHDGVLVWIVSPAVDQPPLSSPSVSAESVMRRVLAPIRSGSGTSETTLGNPRILGE